MSSLLTKSQFVQEFPKDDPECSFINKMMEMTPDVVRNIFRNTEHHTKCHGIFPSCKLPQDYSYGNIAPEIRAFPKLEKTNVYESKFSSNSNSTTRMDSGEQGHPDEAPENYENARQDLIYSDSDEEENSQIPTSLKSNIPLNSSTVSNNNYKVNTIKEEPLSQSKEVYGHKLILDNLDQCTKRLPNLNNFQHFAHYFNSDCMHKSEPKTNSYGSGGDTEPFEESQDTNEINVSINSLHKAPKSTDKTPLNATINNDSIKRESSYNENDIIKFIETVEKTPRIKVNPVYDDIYHEINQKRKIKKELSLSHSVTPAKIPKLNNKDNISNTIDTDCNLSYNNNPNYENVKLSSNKLNIKKEHVVKEKREIKPPINNNKLFVSNDLKNGFNYNKKEKYLVNYYKDNWTVYFRVTLDGFLPHADRNVHKTHNNTIQSNYFVEKQRPLETQKSMPFDSCKNTSSTPTLPTNKKYNYSNNNSNTSNMISKSSYSSINTNNHHHNSVNDSHPELTKPSNTSININAPVSAAHQQQNIMSSSLSLSQCNTKKPKALAKQIFIQTPQYNQKYNTKLAVVKGNQNESNYNDLSDNIKSNNETNSKLSTPVDRKKDNTVSSNLNKSFNSTSNKSMNSSTDNDPDESTIIKGLLLLQRSRYVTKKDFINRMKQLDTKQWLSDADGLKLKAEHHKDTSEYPAYILISLKKYLIYNYSLDVKNDSRRCHFAYVENAKFAHTIWESITKVFKNKMSQMDKHSEEYFYWSVLNVFTLTFCLRIRAILNYRAYRTVSEHCAKLQKMLTEKKLFNSAVSLISSDNDNANSAASSSNTSQVAMHLEKYFRYTSIITSAYRHWEKAETNESKFMEKDQRHEDAWKEMSCEIIERSGGADLSGLNESMPIVIKYIDGFIQLFIEKFLKSNNDMVQLSSNDSYLLNGDNNSEGYHSNNNIM